MTKEIMQSRVKEDMLCLLFPKYGKKKKNKAKHPDCVIFRKEKEIYDEEVDILILGKDKLLSQKFHIFKFKV